MTEKYLWLNRTRLLAVFNAEGTVRQRFSYADARLPITMEQAGKTYYLAYDQVGSLKAVIDGGGNVIKTVHYDSFGNVVSDSNPTLQVPFGFAGGLQDSETGLVRFGYRDYDPETGRWTSKDPIGIFAHNEELYTAGINDFINNIDENGLYVDIGGGLGGVLFGLPAVRGQLGLSVPMGMTMIPGSCGKCYYMTGCFMYGLGLAADLGIEAVVNINDSSPSMHQTDCSWPIGAGGNITRLGLSGSFNSSGVSLTRGLIELIGGGSAVYVMVCYECKRCE